MTNYRSSRRVITTLITLIIMFSMVFSNGMAAPARDEDPVYFTILHTNDVHGQLESAGSNPGMARVATIIKDVRTSVGESNTLVVDAGDEMQGSLLSNLGDGTATGKGAPAIATFNAIGYNVATFGNHEFDWGQVNLANRTTQATYPYVTANIVQNDTGNCSTANWVLPTFASAPYQIQTVGTAPNTAKVAFIGVTTTETPTITVSTATAGLCFKDPANAILHYYDAMKADGAKVIVVLSHLGFADGGYGYGIPVYGDQTLAGKLNTAGKPVNLIIGGHSHTDLTAATTVGSTKIVQAYYNGRKVGREDIIVGTDGSVAITYTSLKPYPSTSVTPPPTAEDPAVKAVIATYANDPAYLALVNTPIGYSSVDLPRFGGNADNMMGTFVDDAIYKYLNTDGESANDIDIFFNNAGGIRTDWCWDTGSSTWINTGCTTGTHAPGLLTYGNMFTILPFGNATVVGHMTGAQIMDVVNYGPAAAGLIQPAGLKYSFYKYVDGNPGPQPYAWGAYDVTVLNKGTGLYEPLDLKKTYSVGTNEFLAPAGGDGFLAFKYMTDITYWGDMLNAVDSYVTANYGSPASAYTGPNGDGSLDGRIGMNGDGDTTYDPGEIVPLTVLHHNDPHGNLYKNGTYAGLTQLATLIKQEKLHNPSRTLLLNAGDTIQGDGISFYFKSSYTGFAVDGTPLTVPPQSTELIVDPIIAAMNLLGYDAMTLGNHEFNFGSGVFQGVLGQANFPILDADVTDGTGGHTYGLAAANHGTGVQPYIEKTLGVEGIKVGIMGLGNPRIPNYELASNILGLTFANNIGVDDPITRAQTIANTLRTNKDDVVLALSHLGFTDPADHWVDTYLAANTSGINAIIGGHSHTDPTNTVAYPYLAPYKYLPGIFAAADGKPVAINTAYRYNYFLGEMVIGLRSNGAGGYDVVSQTGRDIAVCTGGKTGTGLTCPTDTAEDPATKALIDPYKALFTTYNTKTVGVTNAPIDARQAYTQETTGSNLQADAAVYELGSKIPAVHVDFHLSGAMSNTYAALTATPGTPVTLTVANMFTLMPYENSLVVLSMNGPQLKTVLERAYFNYWNYKYTSHSNISYYTTCMLDTNAGNQITYNDLYPAAPNGHNVVSLVINGVPIDFNNASKFYNVSTVNYLAAGSCNFNDAPGTSLWPLNQLVADTQYYVRDAVIDYLSYKGTVSPAVEGRLQFITDTAGPAINKVIGTPKYTSGLNTYVAPATSLTVTVSDAVSGVASCAISLAGPDGTTHPTCAAGDNVFSLSGSDGTYSLTVDAVDKAGNTSQFTETDILDKSSPLLTKTIGDPKFVSGANTYIKSTTQINVAAADDSGSGVAGCTLKVDGGSTVVYTGTNFTLPGPDGAHTLSVACTDNLGNASTLDEIDLVDNTAPLVTITAPKAQFYMHPEYVTFNFGATDAGSGIKSIEGKLDGTVVTNGQVIDMYTLAIADHTLTVTATDNVGNKTIKSVTFSVVTSIQGIMAGVNRFYKEGKIRTKAIASSLNTKLQSAEKALDKGKTKNAITNLNEFIKLVNSKRNKGIDTHSADLLINDAKWVIDLIR